MAAEPGTPPPPITKEPPRNREYDDYRSEMDFDHIDLINRDPHHIHDYLHVEWSHVIGEPEPSIFSMNGVWKLSYKIFVLSKFWCYRILTLLCAVPASCCLGCQFACLAFNQIWCVFPSIKICRIQLEFTKQVIMLFMGVCVSPILNVIVIPLLDAWGRCLSQVIGAWHGRPYVPLHAEDV